MKTLLAILAVAAPLAAQTGPVNPGFEEGELGQTPPGWFLPSALKGARAEIVDRGCRSGRCVKLSYAGGEAFANLMQSLDARPLLGREARLTAAIRVQRGCRAQMWLRVDRPGNAIYLDNMDDRPVRSEEWASYAISAPVAADAQRLTFGLMLFGACEAWFDDVALIDAGEIQAAVEEPPRPLTGRGLENVVAFARLYGYLRWFYPGDEAEGADWDRVAIEGVRAVEDAKDAGELAERLRGVFGPLAPAARIGAWSDAAARGPARIVRWEHFGVGLGNAGSYYSRRVAEQVEAAPAPLRTTLGGVRVEVPLALPAAGDPSAKEKPPSSRRHTARDRATRLAGIVIAWNVFQHFYPYFEIKGTDWPAELPRALRAAASTGEPEHLDTLRALVAALHDGHGYVSGPGQPAAMRLPLLLGWIQGKVVATAVGDGVEGIAPGDAILAIDGQPVARLLERIEARISSATPQYKRWRALFELGMGRPGSAAALRVESPSGEVREASVARNARPPIEKRPAHLSEVAKGVWYVDINRLTSAEWRGSLEKFAAAQGLVIDFRGYPGQLRDAPAFFGVMSEKPMTSAQWHIPKVAAPDRVGMTFGRGREWDLQPRPPLLRAKMVFLTDARAISFAESCLGIVEHYKLGEIVGEPTAGTNGNINPFQLPGGYRLVWTGMKVLKHDGTQHHGVGIRPTIPVERTRAGVAAGRDEILDRGIAVILGGRGGGI